MPIKEPQVDVSEHEHVADSPIEMDEALEITWRIQNQLFDIFNFAYYYYGEDIEACVDRDVPRHAKTLVQLCNSSFS